MNHYDVLGVAKTASDDDIKKAFRKLAMRHHPDRVPDSEKATSEGKFKEIKEAYEFLSDPTKRKVYDAGNSGTYWSTNQQKSHPKSYDDILNELLRKTRYSPDYDDYYHEKKWENWDSEGYGGWGKQAPNSDVAVHYEITLLEAFNGKEISVSYKENGNTRTVTMNIPAGVEHGRKIRASGGGSKINQHQPAGDMYVTISIKEEDKWERHAQHLNYKVDVDVLDLVAGGQVFVTTIDGANLAVQLRPGTPISARIRIPGRGMPVFGDTKVRGDMFLEINPIIKAAVTDEAKELVSKLKHLTS